MLTVGEVEIERLGHSGFMIKGETLVYVDPFETEAGLEKADIILITHGHYDHCSIKDIENLTKSDTVLIITPDVLSKVSRITDKGCDVKIVRPGDTLKVKEIEIEVVPAYNTNKDFHKQRDEWVGYVIGMNNVRIYHAGDTDLIDEMRQLKDIDVAMLPVSGTYVMTAKEAAEAANIIKPKIAVPMHYGGIVGSFADAEIFKRNYNGRTEILG